jgi:hypothetical protein
VNVGVTVLVDDEGSEAIIQVEKTVAGRAELRCRFDEIPIRATFTSVEEASAAALLMRNHFIARGFRPGRSDDPSSI